MCQNRQHSLVVHHMTLFYSSPCLKAKVLILAGFLMVLVGVCCKQKGNHFSSRFLKWRAGCCACFIDCDFRYVRLRSKDLLEYLWNAFYLTITLGLQTWFWVLLFFLEYLENKVLYDFKCSPLEYLAIFECMASLQARPRDSLKKWATQTSDGKCKVEVLKVAWVHVKISWEKVA